MSRPVVEPKLRPLAVAAVLLATAVLSSAPARAQLEELLRRLPGAPGTQTSDLTDAKIAAALKQALEVGTGQAVALTGRLDGFFANEAIKILMPDRLRSLEQGLRVLGLGAQVDEFVLSMNRAAERAAPSARRIFLDAIGEMTFDDVRRILGGPDTAATEYFKGRTTDRLAAAFQPIVGRAMDEVGVTRQYKELTGRAQAIPFLRLDDVDIDRYVVGKALDGLFVMVGEEEKKIRKDPAARVTDLLREVFGGPSR
jgi:hypothetical protein